MVDQEHGMTGVGMNFDDSKFVPSLTLFILTAKPNYNMLVKSRKILGAQPQNQRQSPLDIAHLDLSSWHHIATKLSINLRHGRMPDQNVGN